MEVHKISIMVRMQTGGAKGLGVEGNREKPLNGHRILFWGDGSVLGRDGGCTTLRMH